jgi:hypothetical protein
MAKTDRHHVIPRSLTNDNTEKNIVVVNKRKHAIYHQLFCNLHPTDIVVHLVEYWWGGNWSFVEEALRRRYAREP